MKAAARTKLFTEPDGLRSLLLMLFTTLSVSSTNLSAATRYVNIGNSNPQFPYNNWSKAATNIQDAINAAGNGDTVLVTNGVYATGARAVYGMNNRVAVTKPLMVRSVNGPGVTSIVGYGPNSDSAVRCAYLTNGAMLAGFTLTNGATQTSGDYGTNRSGGGVWCEPGSAVVSNCVLTGNSAAWGGGVYSGTLNNCALVANSADFGGGGIYGTRNNCTLTGNSAVSEGGGTWSGTLNNCIIYYNRSGTGSNYMGATLNYCCTTPSPSGGAGNTNVDPQLASASHLSAASPCRAAGSATYASGVDIDGEPWANPPSIGCDEYWSGAITGALSAAILASYTNVVVGFAVDFEAVIGGRMSASRWDFGDGTVMSNRPYASHAWSTAGDYVVELRAYNQTYPGGGAATVNIHVQAVYYVAVTSTTPLPPYSSWATAATKIQDAVDAAVAGAQVVVTNGVYEAGARAVYGMSNRVAVTKALTVHSVNGPEVTRIVGYQVPGTTNGAGAVRCAYLTNGAVLTGFTLTNGATQMSGDPYTNQSGGAVWCESVSAVVSNCVLKGNSASSLGGAGYSGTFNGCTFVGNSAYDGGGAIFGTLNDCALAGNSASWEGGGAYCATLNNCTLTGNLAVGGGGAYGGTLNRCMLASNSAYSGGGAESATLNNCALIGNSAGWIGGGASDGTLNNCALTGNSADTSGGGAMDGTLNNCTLTGNSAYKGGGACDATLNNCIVYYNRAGAGTNHNYCYTYGFLESISPKTYCSPPPLPTVGTNNVILEPQLAGDSHLSWLSPCRGAGSAAYATGTDIDGESWANPPSIGCDEFWGGVVTGALSATIVASFTDVSVGFAVDFQAVIVGRASASRWDFGDGTVVSNVPYASHSWTAAGDYVVELRAYNEDHSGGVATTATVRVSLPAVHYVDLNNADPAAPYATWAAAAANIQDAIDVSVPGDTVVVTNVVYQSGARVVYGMSTRVAVTKALTVRSVNGPEATSIVGHGPSGPFAIRCAYLASGAMLTGFALTNGATQESGDSSKMQSGGGIWCESLDASVSNCVLVGNSAGWIGGGAYSGRLNNCSLNGNAAFSGGGAFRSTLNNCTLTGNSVEGLGGGAASATLNNCVLTRNSAVFSGGGVSGCTLNNCTVTANSAYESGGASDATLNNCIVYYNRADSGSGPNHDDFSTLNYCCTTPMPAPSSGTGNLADEPQLTSDWRLGLNSPCRGVGSAAYSSGVDMDGEPWASPPSIGCDEYWSSAVTGALSVAILASYTNLAVGFAVDFEAGVGGRASAAHWSFGDGTVVSNRPWSSHAWATAGDYVVELRVYNGTYPGGVAATVTVRVGPQFVHYVMLTNPSPVAPYSTWATAATNIPDAGDAVAQGGALVVVADGLYDVGSRVVHGTSNRLAITRAITVQSVSGSGVTRIAGYQMPGTTTGAAAVRCVYLTNGAVLAGFTLTNGATQRSGKYNVNDAGGAVWCESPSAVVSNCVLTGNAAGLMGGGAYSGSLHNCALMGNSSEWLGGGSYRSTFYNCTLAGNSAAGHGGGTYQGTLSNCTLTGNSANYDGGAASFATLSKCMLAGNSAGGDGGGADFGTLDKCILTGNAAGGDGGGSSSGTLNNCTLARNSAQHGGAASDATLDNCTLADNSARYGGGVSKGLLKNCIVYDNIASPGIGRVVRQRAI